MDPRQHAVYHPSIAPKYTFVWEVKERIPSKRSYDSAQEAVEMGLHQGLEKYKDKLLNVYVMNGGEVLGSWKEEMKQSTAMNID